MWRMQCLQIFFVRVLRAMSAWSQAAAAAVRPKPPNGMYGAMQNKIFHKAIHTTPEW